MNKATVTRNIELTYNVFEIEFETENIFEFTAGQFITIKIDDQVPPCFRAYSIASTPDKNNKFTLCIKRVEGGRGSNWIGDLKAGDQVGYIGPNGDFTHKEQNNELLFIATGTGIAPFKSIIKDLLDKGFKEKIDLVFGVRHEKDLFYRNFFQELEQKHPNFTFTTTLSRPENETWTGNKGRVTEIIEKIDISNETNIYICGLTPMIDSINQILETKGISTEKIHFEKYD